MSKVDITAKEAGVLISGLEQHRSSLTQFEPLGPAEARALDEECHVIQQLIDRLVPIYRKQVT